MRDHLSPADVATACQSLPTVFLRFGSDLFGTTWQVSHVRLVEIEADRPTKSSVLLALVLSQSPPSAKSFEAWLPECLIEPIDQNELKRMVGQAIADMQEAEEPNELLMTALTKLDVVHASEIHSFSSSAYPIGPTRDVFWRNGSRFFFLEIHNES